MAATTPRWALFVFAAVVLVLDLWSKHWAMTSLANPVHPMVITAEAAPSGLAAAFAGRGIGKDELQQRAIAGELIRYRKAKDLKADRPLTEAELGLDLVAADGTGLAPPRRLRVYRDDVGKTLGDVLATDFRVDAAGAQALLDQHVLQATDRIRDLEGAQLQPGEAAVLTERTITVIDGFFRFVYAENFGAAWSLLADAPPLVRQLIFVVISLTACIGLAIWLARGKAATAITAWSLAAILGGAIGNLVDRLRYQAVIDFVYNFVTVDGRVHGWPVYNVADIGITVGVVAIALEMLIRREPAATGDQPAKA